MERKTFQIKDATLSDAGTLEGYGAVYGNVDLGGDILERNSCRNVSDFVQRGAILVGHNWSGLPVATIEDAKQDETGLWFRAQYHSDDESQRARIVAKERLDRGKFLGLSIGYSTVEAEFGTLDGKQIRRIKSWDAHEVSQVVTPMNPQAGATSAKSFEDEYEAALAAVRDFVRRTEALKTLRAAEGRKLSELNRSRLQALAADQEGLLSTVKGLLAETPRKATAEEIALVKAGVRNLMKAGLGTP
jgi:HK97 family phage prohead protease